jgi:asparagine synthase (glutamine-hydrolysing)
MRVASLDADASLMTFGARPIPSHHSLLIWKGRLDNRRDLSARLGLNSPLLTDHDLAAEAFNRWGDDAPNYLEGDWQAGRWEPHRRRLVLSRDVYGNSAWFFARVGDIVAFSSALPLLRAVLPHATPSPLALARTLVVWRSTDGCETCFTEVSRVPPAHAATIHAGETTVRRYWAVEETSAPPCATDDESLHQFSSLLEQAVARRVSPPGPWASTLSAGLDSSAVTVLAGHALAAQGQTLTAFTAVPQARFVAQHGEGAWGDEGPLAREVANTLTNVEYHQFDAAEVTPVDGLRQMLRIQGEPGIAGANYYWILRLMQLVQHAGCRVLLTGQMGNAVLSWRGRRKADLTLSRLRRVPRRVQTLLARWRSAGGTDAWTAYSAVQPTLARELKLAEQMADAGHDPHLRWPNRSDRDVRLALLKPATSPIGAFWSHLGRAFQVEVRDPSQDRQLLACSWTLPDRLWSDGQPRAVIRRVMRGRIPDVVRLHPGGHYQSADIGLRLRDCQAALYEAVEDIAGSASANSLVDVARCRAIVDRLQSPHPPGDLETKAVLMRGLEVGLFLAGAATSSEVLPKGRWCV